MSTKHQNENYSLWGGRFENVSGDGLMKIFNDSLPIDRRLWKEDLNASFRPKFK